MAQLVLLIEGCFLILGSMLVLWWVSPGGHGLQRELGMDSGPIGPKDVAIIASLLFAAGFVFSGGYALQRFVGGITSLVVGGMDQGEGQARSMLVWGLFGYLAVAATFGTFVLLVVERSGHFQRFMDAQFLRLVLTWPYHLMAAVGIFGLPAEAFY